MSAVKDLIARLEAGDDEAAAELEKLFADKDSTATQDKAVMSRELKLKTDAALRGKYPRAIRAYEADDLILPADFSDDALEAALKAKETKLEALGVPASVDSGASANAATEASAVKPDPAKAWDTNRSASGPGHQQPESAEPKLREHLESGATVRQIVDDIHALHREGMGRGLGAFHDTITCDLESEAHPNSVI